MYALRATKNKSFDCEKLSGMHGSVFRLEDVDLSPSDTNAK